MQWSFEAGIDSAESARALLRVKKHQDGVCFRAIYGGNQRAPSYYHITAYYNTRSGG
jgi:hypothetical protein